jgi:hypothetical protein
MLVIVSVSRLDNDSIQIRVARPQHDSTRMLEYNSENRYERFSTFGICTETIDSHLKLLAQMGANEQLNFPPVDVPQHSLLTLGFRL